MSRKIPEFPTAVEVSTTDLILGWQDNVTKNFPVALLQTTLVPPGNLVSLADVSINWDLKNGDFLRYSEGKWSNVSIEFPDVNAIRESIASVDDRATSIDAVTSNLASSLSILEMNVTSLNSVTNARVTSVNNYFLNQTSVLNDKVTSVDSHINTVSNAVSVQGVDLGSRITSVENHVNTVSNRVSNATTSLDGRVTSVENHVNTVSNATSVVNAKAVSIDTYFKNQVSVLGNRITSVKTDLNNTSVAFTNRINSVSANVTSVNNQIVKNLVSLSDVSLATSVGSSGYVVSWDNTKNQFVLLANSGGGGGQGTLTSLSDVSISTSAGVNGYAVVWDNSKNQFVLSSVGGGSSTSTVPLSIAVSAVVGDGTFNTITVHNNIDEKERGMLFIGGVYQNKNTYTTSGNVITLSENLPNGVTAEWNYFNGDTLLEEIGGDIVSVDNRVTSVNSYFLNQVSVLNARSTSIESHVNVVSNRVSNAVTSLDTRITSLRTDITSVESHVNVVSNAVSTKSFDFISGMIPVVSVKRYDLDRRAFRKYVIRSVFAATSSGECTYSLRRNGSNLTGFTSVVASVNTSVVTSGTLVTVEVGDRFDLNVTTNTSAMNTAFTIGIWKV